MQGGWLLSRCLQSRYFVDAGVVVWLVWLVCMAGCCTSALLACVASHDSASLLACSAVKSLLPRRNGTKYKNSKIPKNPGVKCRGNRDILHRGGLAK
jgi:hypothetical protein